MTSWCWVHLKSPPPTLVLLGLSQHSDHLFPSFSSPFLTCLHPGSLPIYPLDLRQFIARFWQGPHTEFNNLSFCLFSLSDHWGLFFISFHLIFGWKRHDSVKVLGLCLCLFGTTEYFLFCLNFSSCMYSCSLNSHCSLSVGQTVIFSLNLSPYSNTCRLPSLSQWGLILLYRGARFQ